ncbi:hypothetical protein PHYBOEH_010589 [Phytophthora boehmeriae]|uniref:Uncharacterized protein n=1 Tax=Phytophthora boehmeriae TaxID=109152 RepID=A0A8T1WZ67_9STRA|nr:hypothetical protein PHYBOEH_004850 [Phytophthora boehmeriae]KAG7398746.1 hypothetical protein PHYBOEH_010589 [Phytophthora boehmeriae]
MLDFDFPFGGKEEPKSEEEKENRDGEDAGRMAEDGKASEILIEDDDSENSVCSSPARDNSCTNNTSTHTEEIEADTAQPNQTRQRTTASRASRAAGTTKANGKRAGNSTRSKPLTLKPNSQRKRKSLDDVMYDSICERTSIAKKRSCIEMAQAKVMFTKDLIELGIYTTEEVKAMVTAQFDDN